MGLDVAVKKRLRFFDLDISFSCPDGKILVLIGPSGGGKTTIVRMIAGLEKPDAGWIGCLGEAWFDPSRALEPAAPEKTPGQCLPGIHPFPPPDAVRQRGLCRPGQTRGRGDDGVLRDRPPA